MILVYKIIWVSSVYFYDTWSVHMLHFFLRPQKSLGEASTEGSFQVYLGTEYCDQKL